MSSNIPPLTFCRFSISLNALKQLKSLKKENSTSADSHPEIAKKILSSYASTEERSRTELEEAAKSSDLARVTELLTPPLSHPESSIGKALQIAAEYNHLPIVQQLLLYHPLISQSDFFISLSHAVRNNQPEMVDEFLHCSTKLTQEGLKAALTLAHAKHFPSVIYLITNTLNKYH